jgi:hypothetical protein
MELFVTRNFHWIQIAKTKHTLLQDLCETNAALIWYIRVFFFSASFVCMQKDNLNRK